MGTRAATASTWKARMRHVSIRVLFRPVLVLTRGEPVEITLVNRMTGADGYSLARHRARQLLRWRARLGWVAQQYHVAGRPGQSFCREVHSRRVAGTFIYHTHWHKTRNWLAASTDRLSSLSLASATIRRPITFSSSA